MVIELIVKNEPGVIAQIFSKIGSVLIKETALITLNEKTQKLIISTNEDIDIDKLNELDCIIKNK